MNKFRKVRNLFAIVLCFFMLQSFWTSPALGSQVDEEEDFTLYLAAAAFDPLESVPTAASGLAFSDIEAASAGVYIIQLSGPVMDAWKQGIIDAGGTLGPYIPNYAFLARLDPTSLQAVKELPYVRWVGPFQPAYKLSASALALESRTYRVLLAPWANLAGAVQAVSSFAARPAQNLAENTLSGQTGQPGEQVTLSLAADLAGDGVLQTARLGDVLWIEPVTLKENFNNVGGGTIMGGTTAWASGYTGAGVSINVTDTGLDSGTASSIHPDFTGRVAHISSWPVVYANYGGGCYPGNAGSDDGPMDVASGHGTHVTGSVAGSGAASSGTFKGLAYASTINFQAVEQYTTWTCGGAGYYLTGIPLDVTPLLQEAYNWGARVQNDSWGSAVAGAYDDTAVDFDAFIYNHQDFTATIAAGNSGTDANSDGYVDQNSMASPGTAKNVITIGASDSLRASGGISTRTWSYYWPSDFPAAPTGTDYTSDNAAEMAAFSSRGPTADGRIKPDVVAPGTNIISVRSSWASGTGWGTYNSDYMYMGGTSMASPLTSGAAALVREYYIDREGLATPSAALIKATLINTAVDISGYGSAGQEAGLPIPNNHEGWGRVNVGAATTPGRLFIDDASGVSTGATRTYTYNVVAGQPFKVSLAWSDPAALPGASVTLVNNLNLRVTAPGGAIYLGNRFSGGWSAAGGSYDDRNNVENVYIQSPASGSWKVEIIGQNIPQGPQRFALVLSGALPPGSFTKISPPDSIEGQPTGVTLSWGTSAGAASYDYCYNTSASCPGGWTDAGANTSVTITGLSGSTTYYWQVRAHNGSSTIDADDEWFRFKTVGSTAPAAFNKSGPANGSTGQDALGLALSWNKSNDAASYEYCYNTSASCPGTWTSAGFTHTTSLPRLAPLTTYYWQVRSRNPIGTTDASGGWWSFTTGEIRTTYLPVIHR